MATTELTTEDFEATVLGEGIVLVDWWADWCGPCKAFAPIYDKASEENPDITFGKIDTDAERELSGLAGIQSIPTLMAFRDGILVFSQAGALPAPALNQVIDAVRGLDMRAVQEEIAKQSADADADAAVSD